MGKITLRIGQVAALAKVQEPALVRAAALTMHKIQTNDSIHFGAHYNRSTSSESSKPAVAARGGQSLLYTAANDGHVDVFIAELEKTVRNPNEVVKGDTSILQVLVGNCTYFNDFFKRHNKAKKQAKDSLNMLKSFLAHPKFELVDEDKRSLSDLTNNMLKLEDKSLLETLTTNQAYDIKALAIDIQDKVWIALGIGEPRHLSPSP